MNRREKDLLHYLEQCVCERAGLLDLFRVGNKPDRKTLEAWRACGFISTGRVCSPDVGVWTGPQSGAQRRNLVAPGTEWVQLSEAAWAAAQEDRLECARKAWANRPWRTEGEYREGVT